MGFKQFRPGVGKRIPKDSVLAWNLHYTFTGKPEKDRPRIGLWFQQVPMSAELITNPGKGDAKVVQGQEILLEEGSRLTELPVIPPNEGNWAATAIIPFQDDVTIHLFWPHMHVRGKDMAYLVTYPDGREEVLLNVPHYTFSWQLIYELDQPLKLPAGSTMKVLTHFDNSVKNRENPAPNKEVYWSEQSWDEMLSGYYDYSIDKRNRRVEATTTSSSR